MSIQFKNEKQLGLKIPYPDFSEDAYLTKLKETFKLHGLTDPGNSDFENVLKIQEWVHFNWEFIKNKGYNNDANFRFSDFNSVTSDCLKALGFTVRNLWLKCVDVEEKNGGKGHILKEVFLKDQNKWFFIDPEFDIIIKKDGIPVNAVELQQALIEEEEIEVINPLEKISSEEYLEWIGSYLFCFTTSLNKGPISLWDRIIGRKKKLTLLPLGEAAPCYLRRLRQARTNIITNSLADFYPVLLK